MAIYVNCSGVLKNKRRGALAATISAAGAAALVAALMSGVSSPETLSRVSTLATFDNAYDESWQGDGLSHVIAITEQVASPGPDTSGHARGSDSNIADLSALTALGQIVEITHDEEGRLVARYDDGRIAVAEGGEARYVDETTPPQSAPEAAPVGEAIVGGTPAALSSVLARGDVDGAENLGGGMWRINGTFHVAEVVSELKAAGVDAYEDGISHILTNDTDFDYQWNLENRADGALVGSYTADADVDWRDNWGVTGAGVTVAVIDSGSRLNSGDLNGQSWVNSDENCSDGTDNDSNGYVDDCGGWDFVTNSKPVWQAAWHPHGTEVSSVIAAKAGNGAGIAGIAPDVKIMDLRALGNSGSGYDSHIVAAINYAVANGADVINLSLGSAGTSCGAFGAALANAAANNVPVAIAAGNSNFDNDGATSIFPASCAGTTHLAVGASDGADGRSSFSNWGATTVDLMAPGTAIPVIHPTEGTVLANGTSFSSPTTAAAMALLVAQNPTWNENQIYSRLLATVDPKTALAGKSLTGGRLNIDAALGYPTAEGPTPTTTTRPAPSGAWNAVFTGFGDPANSITGSVNVNVTDQSIFTGAVDWQLGLYTIIDGDTYGVVSHPMSVDSTARNTRADGTVSLSSSTFSWADNLSTWLPAGTYAITIQPLVAGNTSRAYDEAAILPFTVNGASGTTVTTSAPVTTTRPVTTTAPSNVGATTTRPPTATTQPNSGGGATTTRPATPTTQPNSGGGATTTRPPTATTQPGGAPTTTRPATTTTAATPGTLAPIPTTTAPGSSWSPPPFTPVNNGQWSVTGISPRVVDADGNDFTITINGTFPYEPYVFVGNSHTVVHVPTANSLTVDVTGSQVAGGRDITISYGGQVRVTVPNGIWFVGEDGGAPPAWNPPTTSAPTATTAPAPTTTAAPTATTAPAAATTTRPPATTTTRPATTTTTRPATTTTMPQGAARSRPLLSGTTINHNGISVRQVMANSPLEGFDLAGSMCHSATCPAS